MSTLQGRIPVSRWAQPLSPWCPSPVWPNTQSQAGSWSWGSCAFPPFLRGACGRTGRHTVLREELRSRCTSCIEQAGRFNFSISLLTSWSLLSFSRKVKLILWNSWEPKGFESVMFINLLRALGNEASFCTWSHILTQTKKEKKRERETWEPVGIRAGYFVTEIFHFRHKIHTAVCEPKKAERDSRRAWRTNTSSFNPEECSQVPGEGCPEVWIGSLRRLGLLWW